MKKYSYQNKLVSKKQLRQLLAWTFTNYDSMQASALADELKYLGFKYASQAGISISIEDLKIPFVKNLMLEKANQEIINSEKIYLKGKISEVERFQKIIDTWSLTSESLKKQVVYYFKNYDPLNSVYIMAFSGARGNLSQVRQLVGMRGLMSDPSGEIMNLPIKKNFREGLTITDYLMSGYGARKGVVDTSLKTANSGYLTRRLIDVGQDILIREKNCLTTDSFLISISEFTSTKSDLTYEKILGRILSKTLIDPKTKTKLAKKDSQITPNLVDKCKKTQITKFYVRSPLTCHLYRAICQKCYGWDLANENLVDIGEAIGILAGQSIGEPGTQLTMRTFHTGGIFTSEAQQQIISPVDGIIKYYKVLKSSLFRTNRGEDVLVTKNSGSIVIVPENKKSNLIKIEILKNTILFPKNNQYVLKNTVIGEVINTNKQIKNEIKPILSDASGEIYMPRLKKKVNLLNNNKLLWILSGQLYNSPLHSFVNFYPDYKLNHSSYVFRTKIVSHYDGFVESINNKQNLYQRLLKIANNTCSFQNATLKRLLKTENSQNYLLIVQDQEYLLNIQKKSSKFYICQTQNKQIGSLVTNLFKTLTGGRLYYDFKNSRNIKKTISYVKKRRSRWGHQEKPILSHRTIIWLGEEIHQVNCKPNILLVENGDFISEGFELLPNLFSKTSGIITIRQKNSLIQTISIKYGLVYQGKKLNGTSQKIYYSGERIFLNIFSNHLSFCEHITSETTDQLLLLVRPLQIYEFPHSNSENTNFKNQFKKESNMKLECKTIYSYKPNQQIIGTQNFNLVSGFLTFKPNEFWNRNINVEVFNHEKTKAIDLRITENFNLNNYIIPNLRYKNIQSCLLLQPNQFVDKYTTLGYLEAVNLNSLEIVKFKVKNKDNKQIFLISNEDCFTVEKNRFSKKKKNDFIINSSKVNEIGKIIIENKNLLTLQKGRPYFFPNCKNEDLIGKINLQYKIFSRKRVYPPLKTSHNISLNYYDLMKSSSKINYKTKIFSNETQTLVRKDRRRKIEFSKLYLKKNGKLYSCLIPLFLKEFSINDSKSALKRPPIIDIIPSLTDKLIDFLNIRREKKKQKPLNTQTLLLQSSDLIQNNLKPENLNNYQLTLVRFIEHPFSKANKSISLHSITEDYFEQDVNSVFCKNSEFIEDGETIGLLNLEKEITGDIVQGLPRIEEILEARKKNLTKKRIPTSQKKSLLVQKTSLDPNFEFRKLGTTIQENNKINPHKLLKVYFNYYGLIKVFICDQSKTIQYNRLLGNYESSYKSFTKVQSFILNSVQSVYESQDVKINDKHLEVVIKQMTTKVLITSEGNTPLLIKEVIDLYHIQYINQVIKMEQKQSAFYVPLLIGITKGALNNPSFISAASFQETTRVLTRAAIDGRMDWLRGLKENIIIGHLIPAGTGSKNYQNCFKKQFSAQTNRKQVFDNISDR
jgi:DNA-directed RNA polymerase subunit beta'